MQHTQLITQHPMKAIKIEKVTLNIGTGMPGDKLEKAIRLLTKIAQSKAVSRRTKKRIPAWGIRPGLEIGAKVTIRRKKAEEVLVRLLKAKGNVIPSSKFDTSGNLSFGIAEYLDVPGVDYDATIGIIGFEVAVTLMRPGFRISKRAQKQKRIPQRHRITKDEAMTFMKEKFGVRIE